MESKEALAVLQSRGLSMDGASLASFALRYLRDLHGVSCVLPGMMRPEHLRVNLRAVAEGPLTETERAAATALGDQG
jgi:aryl-alcohol dehydrogenase-like predicted oxidoreductase